jgi:hypothetical protein
MIIEHPGHQDIDFCKQASFPLNRCFFSAPNRSFGLATSPPGRTGSANQYLHFDFYSGFRLQNLMFAPAPIAEPLYLSTRYNYICSHLNGFILNKVKHFPHFSLIFVQDFAI